jgi:hypothetical protein
MLPTRRILLVERERAPTLLLISIIAFAATVVGVRLFLELTGYPQVGGGVLHIAHLLWGGLAMFIGLIVVLIWENPGALYTTAVLSGVGIGLFIDEVGKFITKNNDYFFPAAAPIIYGFFLIVFLVYLLVRRRNAPHPDRALILALDGMQEIAFGELDEVEGARILAHLDLARRSERPEIAQLAATLYDHLAAQQDLLAAYRPGLFKRLAVRIRTWGLKVGRTWHRRLILLGLTINTLSALAVVLLLLIYLLTPGREAFFALLKPVVLEAAQGADAGGVTGQLIHLVLNFITGVSALIAIGLILRGRERTGVIWGMITEIIALTVVQMVTFYLTQFTAIFPTIFQFLMLGLLLTYQTWYLDADEPNLTAAS